MHPETTSATSSPLKAVYHCPTCRSTGFAPSLMRSMCQFCDGTFNGEPPTVEEIFNHNTRLSGSDPCDELIP